MCVFIYTQYTHVGIVCKQTFILKGINGFAALDEILQGTHIVKIKTCNNCAKSLKA